MFYSYEKRINYGWRQFGRIAIFQWLLCKLTRTILVTLKTIKKSVIWVGSIGVFRYHATDCIWGVCLNVIHVYTRLYHTRDLNLKNMVRSTLNTSTVWIFFNDENYILKKSANGTKGKMQHFYMQRSKNVYMHSILRNFRGNDLNKMWNPANVG